MSYPDPNSPSSRAAHIQALTDHRDHLLRTITAARNSWIDTRRQLDQLGHNPTTSHPFPGAMTPTIHALRGRAAGYQIVIRQQQPLVRRAQRCLRLARWDEAYLAGEERVEEERVRFGREEEARVRMGEEGVARRIVAMEEEIARREVEIAERLEGEVVEGGGVAEEVVERAEWMDRKIAEMEAELEEKEARARRERRKAGKAAKRERGETAMEAGAGGAAGSETAARMAVQGEEEGEATLKNGKKRKRNETAEAEESGEQKETEETEAQQVSEMSNRNSAGANKGDKGKGKGKEKEHR